MGILRLRDENGNIFEVPVLPGTPGKDGKDGYTPQKGVDYFDGKDGYPQVFIDLTSL